ncbi:1-acyl-sn-glycerol-3-phosphate acyltransferase [candidate division KSB1 bacterium]|nr:1-acyl-sn-glycerol-3-phosphate acyltransferase [candidate division KSB1 bacterium]
MVFWMSLAIIYLFTKIYFRATSVDRHLFPRKGPAITVVNHNSNMDVFAMSLVVRTPVHAMAKDTLFKVPILKSWLRAVGGFPVVRNASDTQAFDTALSILQNGGILFLAPEGTRKKINGQNPRPKTGFVRLAQLTGCPIVPVAIYGTDRVLPPNAWFPKPVKIAVKVGAPILLEKTEVTIENKDKLQKQADEVMEIIYGMQQELRTQYEKK